MRPTLSAACLCLASFASAFAQTAARPIAGSVIGTDGTAVGRANVFLYETLEGDLSDDDGRFAFSTAAGGELTLIVLADGFREHRRRLAMPLREPLVIRLEREPIRLDPIIAQAGRLAAGGGPSVELSSLQVVTTPGAAADVYRVFQTFPGLQPVDEGAGLFVRGGDVFETKVFLNDAVVLSPYRYESPTGGFFGSFDPFLLDDIHFSTGAFGARYGDALSGIATLSTLGRPEQAEAGATVSLATASAAAAAPIAAGLGARATATRSHTDLLFRVNGSTAEFTEPPEGRDLSGSLVWEYRPDGELKLFAMDQWSRLGVIVDDPADRDAFETDEQQDIAVLSWRHRFGAVSAAATAATAGEAVEQEIGVFRLTTTERLRQARGEISLDLRSRLTLTLGGEAERRRSDFDGELPDDHYDRAQGSPAAAFRSSTASTRDALFVEADGYPTDRLRLTGGVRTDRSTLAGQRSWDPRLSAAYRAGDQTTLVAAWGVYHQVPSPYLYARAADETPLPPMRAIHAVAGLHLGGEEFLLRVEAFAKRYNDLAQRDRERRPVGAGRGTSRGIDLFVRWPEGRGFSGRTSLALLRARRTDPTTGTMARSPFEIGQAWTNVVEKRIGSGWLFSLSSRRSSGRPFTPVTSASLDPERDLWVPEYGEPGSDRLPSFHRVDVAGSRLVALPGNRLLVLFGAVNNLFDRTNVHDITYSADYSETRLVRSHFNRSVYFGATVSF